MPYFKRARPGTVATLGGHMITFQADEPTYIVDEPEVIQAVISSGAIECDEPTYVADAPEEVAAAPSRAGKKKGAAATADAAADDAAEA